jgi:hypothetical protein
MRESSRDNAPDDYRLYEKRALCENPEHVSTPVALRTSPRPAAAKRPRGRPRKTLDERDEGNRRRQLVQAAARLFRRQGFDGTSTRDIAAAVGMQGVALHHFKSKGELLRAVIEQGTGGHRPAGSGAGRRARRRRCPGCAG